MRLARNNPVPLAGTRPNIVFIFSVEVARNLAVPLTNLDAQE